MMILGKAFNQYTLLGNGPIGPGLALAGILFVLFYIFGRNATLRAQWSQIIIMAVAALLFGIGGVILINCSFDTSPPTIYPAKVLGHHIRHHSRSDSYYLTLSHWSPADEKQEVT